MRIYTLRRAEDNLKFDTRESIWEILLARICETICSFQAIVELRSELDVVSIEKKTALLLEVVPDTQPGVMEAVRQADDLKQQAENLQM